MTCSTVTTAAADGARPPPRAGGQHHGRRLLRRVRRARPSDPLGRWRCHGPPVRLGLDVRVGIHTGECEVRGDDLAGIAVHIGARVAHLAAPGQVVVTGTVRDLVAGSGIAFEERGAFTLKGVPGSWTLLAAHDQE